MIRIALVLPALLAGLVHRTPEATAGAAFDPIERAAGSHETAASNALVPVSTVPKLDFGAVQIGTAQRRSIPVHNAGLVPVTISAIDTDDGRFRVMSAERVVPPSSSLAVEIEYAPTGASIDVASLAIAFEGEPEPQLVVPLRGQGCDLDESRCSDEAAQP